MAKKPGLLMAAIAIIAIAIAVPALAVAAPLGTDPPGTAVAVGVKMELTNIGTVSTETALGKIGCATATWTGEVTINTPGRFTASRTGTNTATNCTLAGKAITITDITWPELDSTTSGKGVMTLTFTGDLPNGLACHWEGTVPYTYTPGGSVIAILKGDLKGTPAACEPGLFTMESTIETDGPNVHIVLD